MKRRDNSNSSGSEERVSPAPPPRKRNRLSYVCQACRQAKTKCDREKPQCRRCFKLGTECIYDTLIQAAPKHLSKDARILQLENELDFWQKKTKALLQEQEDLILQRNKDTKGRKRSQNSDKTFYSGNLFTTATLRSLYNDDYDHSNPTVEGDDVRINLCQSNPRLIMSRVMKREVNPLSEYYLMINDTFFATLLTSLFINSKKSSYELFKYSGCNNNGIFNGNPHPDNSTKTSTIISALAADISISKTQPTIRSDVLKLKTLLLNKYSKAHDKQRVKINNFFDRMLRMTSPENGLQIRQLLTSATSSNQKEYLEDHINIDPNDRESLNYSNLLAQLVNDYESTLPPLHVINKYKLHFFENIYALLPFVDIGMFEETIQKTIIKDPSNPNEKCKIQLGTSGLRNKLENIGILGCILRISYMSLHMLDEDGEDYQKCHVDKETLHNYPIGNNMIILALQRIASENWCSCPNENIIANLLYIWAFFVFTPDEVDIFIDTPSDIISDVVIMLSSAIGLHRDPSDYKELKETRDQRLLNHRRLLWLSIISMSSFESAIRGRRIQSNRLLDSFIDIDSPNAFEEYMTRVKNDIPKDSRTSVSLISLHELAWRRTHLALLHQNLNYLTMSYHDNITTSDVEDSIKAIDDFLHEKLSFTSANVNVVNLEGSPEDVLFQMSILTTRPSLLFISKILSKTLELRTTVALLLHFEVVSIEERQYLRYYLNYLKKSAVYSIELVQLYQEYYHGSNNNGISILTRYYISKFLQMALTTAMFALLVIIMRFKLSETLYIHDEQNNSKKDLNEKIAVLQEIIDSLIPVLKKIHKIGNDHLKFSYFSTFKMLSMYDLLIQRIGNGKLWVGLFQTINIEEIDPRMRKFLKMTFNLQFNNEKGSEQGNRLIDLLLRKNHIPYISVDDLTGLLNVLKSAIAAGSNCAENGITNTSTTDDERHTARPAMDSSESTVTAELSTGADDHMFDDLTGNIGVFENGGSANYGMNNNMTDFFDIFTPDGGELSQNLTGIFGNLDIFDSDLFFSNE